MWKKSLNFQNAEQIRQNKYVCQNDSTFSTILCNKIKKKYAVLYEREKKAHYMSMGFIKEIRLLYL